MQSFLSSNLSSDPTKAGIAQGLFGSADPDELSWPCWSSRSASPRPSTSRSTRATTRLTRLLNTTVRNLAGVPAVVYGLLGLAVFVRVHWTR